MTPATKKKVLIGAGVLVAILMFLWFGYALGQSNRPTVKLPPGASMKDGQVSCPACPEQKPCPERDCPPAPPMAPCPPAAKQRPCPLAKSAPTAIAPPVTAQQPPAPAPVTAETPRPQPLCCGQELASPDEYRRQYEAWIERK